MLPCYRAVILVDKALPDIALGSQNPKAQSPVDLEDRTRGIRKCAGCDHPDCAADIVGCSPPPDRCDALGDLPIVQVADWLGHRGFDQTGADLVDTNPLPGQSNGEELSDHAQACLRHAVF